MDKIMYLCKVPFSTYRLPRLVVEGIFIFPINDQRVPVKRMTIPAD